jgi:hypothetical protein
MAKTQGDIFLEYQCRRAMKNIRSFDHGHYRRFLWVQQVVRDALVFSKREGNAPHHNININISGNGDTTPGSNEYKSSNDYAITA